MSANVAGAAGQPVDEAAEFETAVGQAIEACGGDPIATVRALILANSMLERELAALSQSRPADSYAASAWSRGCKILQRGVESFNARGSGGNLSNVIRAAAQPCANSRIRAPTDRDMMAA